MPSTCRDTCPTVGQPGPVARQLHEAQGLVVHGEAGAGAEAHVVQGGRRGAKTQVQAAVSLGVSDINRKSLSVPQQMNG